jgi:tetratricopeptide (TPR) repeat protein
MMRRSLNLPHLSCLFAAAFLLASFACGSSPAYAQDEDASSEERAKVRVFEALDLMDVGSYGEARLVLQLALGLNSSLDRAWYYLAQCNVELKNWVEALDALSKYEAAELSEHERMQIADLRAKIQDQQAAEQGSDKTAAATTDSETSASEEAAVSKSDTDAAAAAQASASVSSKGALPQPGPVLMVIGGIVGGIGATVATISLAQGVEAKDSSEWDALEDGRGPYWAGLATGIGGAVIFAAGIPITAIGNKKKASVVISYQADDVQPRASVYLVGKW